MVMEGDMTGAGKHIVQYIDNGLQNYIPETHVILLINGTLTSSIKISYCEAWRSSNYSLLITHR